MSFHLRPRPMSLSRARSLQSRRWTLALRGRTRFRPRAQLLEDRTLLSPFYDLTTLASTASGAFTSLGDLVSANHYGDVAFVGATGSGVFGDSGLYVERAGTTTPVNINPTFSSDPSRNFGQAAEINDFDLVTARDQVASSPAQFLVRQWNASQPNANVILAHVPPTGPGSPDGQYSALQTFTDINDDGDMVFVALSSDGSSRSVNFVSHSNVGLDTYQTIEQMPAGALPSPQPQLTDQGQILYYSTKDNSIKLADPSTGQVTVIASASVGGFSSLGAAPGVSADGNVVVFTGTTAGGLPGVYAVYKSRGAWSKPVRIAGGGMDSFTSFDSTSAVQVEGSLSDGERGMTVAFVGTSQDEGTGLYTSRLSFFGTSAASFDPSAVQSVLVNGVEQVAKVGDTLPDGSTIAKIVFWHGFDWRNRGTLTFWAQTNAGQEIVQANPWQLVWLDFDPTTTTTEISSQGNSALLSKVGITQSGWSGSTQTALSNLGLPQNYDYGALETAVVNEVQDQFTKAGARIKVTESQPADIPEPGVNAAGQGVVHGAYKTVYIGALPQLHPTSWGKRRPWISSIKWRTIRPLYSSTRSSIRAALAASRLRRRLTW